MKDISGQRAEFTETIVSSVVGAAAWTDAKKGVESAWEELRTAMDEARAEFTDAEEDEKTSLPV